MPQEIQTPQIDSCFRLVYYRLHSRLCILDSDVGGSNKFGNPQGGYHNSSLPSTKVSRAEEERARRAEQDLNDRLHKQQLDKIEEEYQQSLIDRANRERIERERRNREDEAKMNQRQREIEALLQSTKATSALISNSSQIESVALYARLQKALFELTSLSKRAEALNLEIKVANQDFTKQEQRVERDFQTKGRESERLEDTKEKKRKLLSVRDELRRKVDNRKEEIRKLRVETGNAGTAKLDDEVQNDLDRIDRLLEAKGQELKREKFRYEQLRDQYEAFQNQLYEKKQKAISEDTLNQTRPGTPPRQNNFTALDLGGSSHIHGHMMRSGIENSGIKQSNVSRASRTLPKTHSELKATPGSLFLDE